MGKMYADYQGTFLYVDKSKDDNNFVNLRIEEEQEDSTYLKININLHESDIKDLIKELKGLIK